MSSPVFSLPMLCALHIASHDRPALEAIVKTERFLRNYEAPSCKKGKTAETESTSKQESSKIYESTQRKITFNSSWKESFPWLEYHVINKEGKMFCFVCRRYDHSSSFCVGSTNFKLEAIKAHARSASHKQNQMRFGATRKPEATVAYKTLMKLHQKTIEQMKILFRSAHALAKHGHPFSDFQWLGFL